MRAAPGRACEAPRLIVRLSRQIGIAFLNMTGGVCLPIEPPKVAEYVEFRVNPLCRTGAVVAEDGLWTQAVGRGRENTAERRPISAQLDLKVRPQRAPRTGDGPAAGPKSLNVPVRNTGNGSPRQRPVAQR